MTEFRMSAEERAKARARYHKRRELILARLRQRYHDDEAHRAKVLGRQRERYRAYREAFARLRAWGVE